jgi:uncharacterized protein YodC (DUF2158 family)
MELGNVVRLQSGGPLMTVNAIADGIVSCVWFPSEGEDFGPLEEGDFPSSDLIVVE